MSTTVDRLIDGGGMVSWATLRALMRLGLIERGQREPGGRHSVWQLAWPDGHTLVLRMGLVDRTREADRRLAEENAGITDSWKEES